MGKKAKTDPVPPADLAGTYLGMNSLHAELGTEPANGASLCPAALTYSEALAILAEAIEAEQAAIFADQVPTYRLTVAWLCAQTAKAHYHDGLLRRHQQRSNRGLSPQRTIPEETS